MQTRHNAYKNTQRLMKLASLLQVCHGESVEGVVWDTLARSALQVDGEIFYNTVENAEVRESREVLHILHHKDEVEEILRSILIKLTKSIEFLHCISRKIAEKDRAGRQKQMK